MALNPLWPPTTVVYFRPGDAGRHRSWPAWEGGLGHAEGLSGLMCPFALSPVPHVSAACAASIPRTLGICPRRCLRRPFHSCRLQEGPITHRWDRQSSDHCKDCLLPNRVIWSRLLLSEVLGGLLLPTQILPPFLLFLLAQEKSTAASQQAGFTERATITFLIRRINKNNHHS